MELIKGAPVSAKIKEEVGAMLEKINGPAPKLAIIRVGENPDDMSYERGAVKKMDSAPSAIHFQLTSQTKHSKKNLPLSTKTRM